MKQIIELKDFYRKDAVEFFSTFYTPSTTMTHEVECTGVRERAKAQGISFSLFYTHAMLKATNEIEEFRYRIDEKGQIVLYDVIHTNIIANSGGNEVVTVILPLKYDADLHRFCKEAMNQINTIKAGESLAARQKEIWGNELNYFPISTVPFLSFTSNNMTVNKRWEGFIPLSVVGKLVVREGKEYLPIAICTNHAFVDGYYLGKFFDRVKELLKG